jgi:hypothetical protein
LHARQTKKAPQTGAFLIYIHVYLVQDRKRQHIDLI